MVKPLYNAVDVFDLFRYPLEMALSNAERQARYQQRRKQRDSECITSDDVVRAVRLIYDEQARFPENRLPPFEDWLAEQRSKKRGGSWRDMLPDDPDSETYVDFSADEADLLIKVAKVVRAMHFPPSD